MNLLIEWTPVCYEVIRIVKNHPITHLRHTLADVEIGTLTILRHAVFTDRHGYAGGEEAVELLDEITDGKEGFFLPLTNLPIRHRQVELLKLKPSTAHGECVDSHAKDGQVVDWDAIKRYHMTAPEYLMIDIGYHAGVERINGKVTVLEGRPITLKGGHTKGHNDMLGICIVGNFDATIPDDEILQAGANMIRQWLIMFPLLTVEDVHKHSEYADKSCPGKLFPWARFKAMI